MRPTDITQTPSPPRPNASNRAESLVLGIPRDSLQQTRPRSHTPPWPQTKNAYVTGRKVTRTVTNPVMTLECMNAILAGGYQPYTVYGDFRCAASSCSSGERRLLTGRSLGGIFESAALLQDTAEQSPRGAVADGANHQYF
jgi:hypothetical protein